MNPELLSYLTWDTFLNFCVLQLSHLSNENNRIYVIRFFEKDGTSLAGQWLGLLAFTVEDLGSVPSWGTKIPHAVQCGQKKKNFFLIEKEMR